MQRSGARGSKWLVLGTFSTQISSPKLGTGAVAAALSLVVVVVCFTALVQRVTAHIPDALPVPQGMNWDWGTVRL
jgi:hypothetical protein